MSKDKGASKGNKYIASCSFGKDSIATILLALEHSEPLDEIFYVEVMYDNSRDISAEHPEHRDFIHNKAIPYFENHGVHVEARKSEKDFIQNFHHVRQRGGYIGMKNGFPLSGRCEINRECKMRTINKYSREIKDAGYHAIHYVGIAKDEPIRLERMNDDEISLMAKYDVTEDMAVQICKDKGLYSPLYQYSHRGGCWFCPNASMKELRAMWDARPDLLLELCDLEKEDNIIKKYFNGFRKELISDVVEQFQWEDKQMTIFDFLE